MMSHAEYVIFSLMSSLPCSQEGNNMRAVGIVLLWLTLLLSTLWGSGGLKCYNCDYGHGFSRPNKSRAANNITKIPFNESCKGNPVPELLVDCDSLMMSGGGVEGGPGDGHSRNFACAELVFDGKSRSTGKRLRTTIRTCVPTVVHNNATGTVSPSSCARGNLQNLPEEVDEPAIKSFLTDFLNNVYYGNASSSACTCNQDYCNGPLVVNNETLIINDQNYTENNNSPSGHGHANSVPRTEALGGFLTLLILTMSCFCINKN